jgi:hypothetical protein
MMNLIPDDMPLLGQMALGASYGGLALAVVAITLYWLVRLLIVAPPAPLERAYAHLRAPGKVPSVGRHSIAAAAALPLRGSPTLVLEAVDECGSP